MTRTRSARLALTLGLLGALTACGSGSGDDATSAAGGASTAAAATTWAFTHSKGTTQIPTKAQRIVTTTDQNALLPLLELGVKPVGSNGLVGKDGNKTFRRTEGFDTTGIAHTGAYGEANAEAVAALRPDLIVGYEFDADSYDTLSRIAPTVLVKVFGRGLDEALMEHAELVGQTAKAEELRTAYQARIQALLDKLADNKTRLSVSVITAGDSGQFYRADDGQALGTRLRGPRSQPPGTPARRTQP